MYRIEILRSRGKNPKRKFYWRLKGANGEIMSQSQTLVKKPTKTANALKAAFKKGKAKIIDLTK